MVHNEGLTLIFGRSWLLDGYKCFKFFWHLLITVPLDFSILKVLHDKENGCHRRRNAKAAIAGTRTGAAYHIGHSHWWIFFWQKLVAIDTRTQHSFCGSFVDCSLFVDFNAAFVRLLLHLIRLNFVGSTRCLQLTGETPIVEGQTSSNHAYVVCSENLTLRSSVSGLGFGS